MSDAGDILMAQLIEEAKKQVKDWYNPDTSRQWVEQAIPNECDPKRTDCYTKVFVLEGGEPKGTVIANYHDGTVLALGRYYDKMKLYRIYRFETEHPDKIICPLVERKS